MREKVGKIKMDKIANSWDPKEKNISKDETHFEKKKKQIGKKIGKANLSKYEEDRKTFDAILLCSINFRFSSNFFLFFIKFLSFSVSDFHFRRKTITVRRQRIFRNANPILSADVRWRRRQRRRRRRPWTTYWRRKSWSKESCGNGTMTRKNRTVPDPVSDRVRRRTTAGEEREVWKEKSLFFAIQRKVRM